jgi:hypothetical protein
MVMPTVVDLKTKRRKRASRALPLEQATDTARFFGRMARAIENDLGGRRGLTRIETELVHAFCGAATAVNYLNRQIILDEGSEVDLASFATLASTMLRIGARLGLQRRQKDVTTLSDLIRADQEIERQRLVREQQALDEGVEP